MSNYTKTTNFAAKDSLPSGNANKIVKGTEIDTEFDNIATASATKADIAGPTFTGTVTIPTVDLNGGAIDGTTVGASTAAAITGTTIVANTSINIAGDGATVTGIKDEDDMSSNSATKLATQQSIKAYVDSQVTAQDLDFQADSGGALSIDLDSETLTFTGGTGVDTSGSGNAVTFAIDSTVATLTGTQTLTNKTLTSPTLNTPTIGTSFTIGSATITEAELEILDGATVTTAELNILDGVTATTAEINYVDGVTSNVQTQLDAKAPIASPTFTGTVTVPGLTTSANILFGDNDKAIFGAGSDLQIFHNGTESFIRDVGTGGLKIDSNGPDLTLRVNATESAIVANSNGSVDLYYDNALKLTTTSTGIDVTGTATMDGLTVSGAQNSKVAYFDDSSEAGHRQLQFTSSNNGQYWDINSQGTSGGLGGVLTLSTRGSERLTIDTSGNVGIGVTPESWNTYKTLQIGNGAIANYTPTHDMRMVSNAYYNSGWKYAESDGACLYLQDGDNSAHTWSVAASGTADAALTWSEAMRITSAGNVGIGTSSPTKTLVVNENDSECVVIIKSSDTGSAGVYLGGQSDEIKAGMILDNSTNALILRGYNNAERMRIDSSGNVGIGGAAAAVTHGPHLDLVGNRGTLTVGTGYFEDNGTTNFIGGSRSLAFGAGGSGERMRIDSSGNLLVGKTGTGNSLAGLRLRNLSGTQGIIYISKTVSGNKNAINNYHNGTYVGGVNYSDTATSFPTSSDQRLKKNIADAPSASEDIDAIQVRSFDWKVDGSHQKYGMVAQELQSVAPEAVSQGETEEDMMGVDYSKLVPMLVKEIQSLRNRVAQLENN